MRLTRFISANIRRKILSSFVVVIILVLVLAVATFTQLELVRSISRQVTPSSSRLTALQDYNLAMSGFEGNLDRYFVIGGPQFQEAMREDVEEVKHALDVAGVSISPEMIPVYNNLVDTTQQLETELAVLLELDPSDLASREANERIVAVFSQVEAARELVKDLAELTSAQLQESALNQETLISSIIVQTLTFAGVVLLLLVVASVIVTRSIARPLAELTAATQQIEQGNLDVQVPVTTQDEVGQLAQTFNSMVGQLRNILRTLEERTQGLTIVGAINERLTGILNIDQLLDEVVDQIKDNFNYYHVHIYLFNQAKDRLVVAAGTGPAGATMKANQHGIDVNAKSLVARAARNANVVSIANVRQEDHWLPNPLLPDTQAEMAIPVILEGQVVGVLDVQEDKTDAFDEASFDLLKSVADQVAVGIRNARQFEQVQSALAELQAIQTRYLEQSWDRASLSRFTSAQADVQLADEIAETTPVLTRPIEFRQVTIGSLELEDTTPQRVWSEDELTLVVAVVDQLAQSAENLRLFEETRQQAYYERLTNEITEKLRQAPTLEALAKMATDELGHLLGATHAKLDLGVEAEANGHGLTTEQRNGKDNG